MPNNSPIGRDRLEFTISKIYLPALIRGDTSGLSLADLGNLARFERRALDSLPLNVLSDHWTVDVEDCTIFAPCEVCGLMSDVCDVALEFTFMKDQPK